jgi:hypothetical protein
VSSTATGPSPLQQRAGDDSQHLEPIGRKVSTVRSPGGERPERNRRRGTSRPHQHGPTAPTVHPVEEVSDEARLAYADPAVHDHGAQVATRQHLELLAATDKWASL